MKTITCVTDLTFGDAGKGTSVQRLVKETNSGLVIRAGGGSQCAHTVISPKGIVHTFCQFGSGTLVGANTFYGPATYFNPIVCDIEATALETKGVVNPKGLFYLHENALVTTPYHRALNRLKEISRKKAIHGSCGVGIGETARIGIEHPDVALRVKELMLPNGYLSLFYEDLQKLVWSEVKKLKNDLNLKDSAVIAEIETFKVPISELIERTKKALEGITIITEKDTSGFLNGFDSCVAEGNQGVLIDEDYGFHPYTTWSKTTSHHVYNLRSAYNLSHEIKDYGVIRTFLTRHGPGPFPSEDPTLSKDLAELHNSNNQWQQHFRIGYFDPLLLQYAIAVNRGVDGLIVSHCDWISKTPWLSVLEYANMDKLVPSKYPNLEIQERITNNLLLASPIYEAKVIKQEEVISTIAAKLETNIVMKSDGPEFGQYKLNPT